MPKLKQTEQQQKANLLRGIIDKQMHIYGLDRRAIAARLCISYESFNRRYNDPRRWTYSEIYTLFRVLHFSDEEKLAVM